MAKKKQSDDDKLQSVIKDFEAAWNYTSSAWHPRWKDNHDLYNGNRTKIGYQGITNTFVPMPFSTVETIVAALFGTKPKIEYLAPSTKPDQPTEILNALYDSFYERDQWSVKNIHVGRSFAKLGTAITFYAYENGCVHKHVIPVRDFFIDPTSSDGEDARYMGRRYLITKQQLEEYEVVDLDNPIETPVFDEFGQAVSVETEYAMKKRYTNLDKIKVEGGSQGENTDKQEKDMWYGSTFENPEDEQIEVIEYWTNDRVISIANRSTVIEDAENPHLVRAKMNGQEYAKGLMPFAWARNYVDESLFYAKGEIDMIADEAELLNDITNQNIDSITFSLNQMYTLDPRYGDQINEVENIPGAVYPFEANALVPIPQRPIPPDAFAERQNIKNEIRETTASNEVIKGADSQGGKATATEINAQVMGAGQRINLKVTQLENEFFHREARIVFGLVKLYMTEPQMVRVIGKDGTNWELFDPSEFQDDYEPRAQLDISVQAKRQEEAAMAKEMLGAFLGDPDINQQELKKMVLMRSFDLDPDEVQTLVQPMPIDPMTGMPMMPGAAIPGEVPTPAPGMMPPEDMMLEQPMPEGALL